MLILPATVRNKDKKPYDNIMSGLWTDYKVTQVEDQTQFCLPLNRDTEHLYYNTFLVIDANVLTEPRVFQISKVNRSNSKGIAIFTCAQDLANQHTLKADYDVDGNVVAWWADWKASEVEPTPAVPIDDPTPSPTTTATIICSGKQQIRIGGSAKTFTVKFADEDGTSIDTLPGTWEFSIDGKSVPQKLLTLTVIDNRIKVKFLGDDSYIGKILTVTYKVDDEDIIASLPIEIIAL